MPDNHDHAKRLNIMAERLVLNSSADFGGCAVIIPPSQDGTQPIEILMLDTQGDVAQFLATVLTRIQTMAREIDDRKKMPSGWRG